MNGYGSHTFKFVNANGAGSWCKFHFKVRFEAYYFALYASKFEKLLQLVRSRHQKFTSGQSCTIIRRKS